MGIDKKLNIMDTKEVSAALKIGMTSTYKLMRRPDFPLIKIGSKMCVKEDDLIEFLNTYKGSQIYL